MWQKPIVCNFDQEQTHFITFTSQLLSLILICWICNFQNKFKSTSILSISHLQEPRCMCIRFFTSASINNITATKKYVCLHHLQIIAVRYIFLMLCIIITWLTLLYYNYFCLILFLVTMLADLFTYLIWLVRA